MLGHGFVIWVFQKFIGIVPDKAFSGEKEKVLEKPF